MAANDEPWVILDTSTLRHIVEGVRGHLDIAALGALPRGPTGISDVAATELARQIVDRRIDAKRWHRVADALDPLLDRELPIVPILAGAGVMLGVPQDLADPSKPRSDLAAGQRAFWAGLRRLSPRAGAREVFMDGHRHRFSRAGLRRTLDRMEARWRDGILGVQREDGRRWQSQHRQELREKVWLNFGSVFGNADVELVVEALTERILSASRSQPYKPKLNDAMDFEHLVLVALPGLVVTSDERLIRFIERLPKIDGRPPRGADRVMTPATLFERLRAKP